MQRKILNLQWQIEHSNAWDFFFHTCEDLKLDFDYLATTKYFETIHVCRYYIYI